MQSTSAAIGIKLLYDLSIFKNQNTYCSDSRQNEKLVGLILLTRHGARTPLSLINGIEEIAYTPELLNPYVQANYKLVTLDNKDFAQKDADNDIVNLSRKLKGGAGKGQLTSLGEKQLFQLGRRFRQKYINDMKFLSGNYDENEIYIRSSHLRRTINSAKSLLAGLYLESSSTNSNQPFLIHVNDAETDYLFPNTGNCAYLKEFYQKVGNEDKLKLNEDYVKFRNKLSAETGCVDSSFSMIKSLTDDIFVRLAHEKHVPENLKALFEESFPWSTFEMKMDMTPKLHLFFGQFFGLMKNNIEKFIMNDIDQKVDSEKLFYYSAHDTTINGILLGLDLVDENHRWPPFAANIVIELWKDKDCDTKDLDNYFIRLYYCDQLKSLKSECSNDDPTKCKLNNFIRILDKHSISRSTY